MVARNHRIRFGANNFITGLTPVAASAMSGYPITNLTDSQRSLVYRTNGNFTIGSTNDEIYINDGTNKTVSLTNADYSGGAALASHIQTQLNASSSSWTCTYSTSTSKFTISRSSGTDTLRFTQTTNAAWDTLGYTTATDESATTHGVGDVARIHTDEHITIDLGSAQAVTAFHLIGPLSEVFSISTTATLTLMGNGSNAWTAPTYSTSPTRTAGGVHAYLDTEAGTSTTFRYWRFKWADRTNTVGSQGFKLGHIYLGDTTTLTTTNIAPGFAVNLVDPSEEFESDGGALFHRVKTKYRTIDGCRVQLLDTRSERLELQEMIDDVGVSVPFYCTFDPTLVYSDDLSELTMYCRFLDDPPTFTHVVRDIYSMEFALREAI